MSNETIENDPAAVKPTKQRARRFPLMAKDRPCISWNTQSSSDPKQWLKWQAEFPRCGFGYDLANSGLIVVDVDRKEGKNGEASFEALIAKHGLLPRTLSHQSPSGGWHYFFRATDKVRPLTLQNAFGEHIDSPGYVPLPNHEFPTGTYMVIDNMPVADAPDWFAEYLVKSSAERVEQISEHDLDTPGNIERAVKYLQGLPPGRTEREMRDVGSMLKDLGISEAVGFDLVCEHLADRCDPPWAHDDELRTKLHNGYVYARENKPGYISAEAINASFDTLTPDELKVKAKANHSGVVSKRGSDYKLEKINWVWPGRLARGKQTLWSGRYGTGKGLLQAYAQARVTTGGKWLDAVEPCPKGRVLVLTAEDGIGDTVIPRLIAAGGDPDMIEVIEAVQDETKKGVHRFSLLTDLDALEKRCKEFGDVVLVTIDPISSYLGTEIKSGGNAATRAVLDPIKDFAERANVSVLAITHNRKAQDGSAGDRILESTAFPAAARAVFMTFEKLDDDKVPTGVMQLLCVKLNLPGKRPAGLEYEVEPLVGGKFEYGSLIHEDGTPLEAARIKWIGMTEMSADDAVRQENKRPAPALSEAIQFLNDFLSDGPRGAEEVEDAAVNGRMISKATLKRAREKLGVVATKVGLDGGWVWSIPERFAGFNPEEAHEEAHPPGS